MRRGSKSPLTTLQSHISAAFWRDAAKHIESGLVRAGVACSPRQAKRIAETGHVPGRWRVALLRILDGAIERNEAELRRLREELRLHEYAEAREAARAASNGLGADS